MLNFFFFKQKTAYEMRISDWSSDVCSSDLLVLPAAQPFGCPRLTHEGEGLRDDKGEILAEQGIHLSRARQRGIFPDAEDPLPAARVMSADLDRLASENHTLPVKRRSQMTADERNPGSRPHHHLLEHPKRSAERRDGNECVRPCRSRGFPAHNKT